MLDILPIILSLSALPISDSLSMIDPESAFAYLAAKKNVAFDARLAPVRYAVPPEAAKLHAYMEAASRGFDARIQRAMAAINTMPNRLLAMKYYARRRGNISAQWTWSAREINQFKQSGDYRRAIAEVEKVKRVFMEMNPGYTLSANTEVRTLADQVANWNTTGSVRAAGGNLMKQCIKMLADTTIPEKPDKAGLSAFMRILAAQKVSHVPTVAVPGFSQHGQLRAFDFVIRQTGEIVAGATAGTVPRAWDAEGWTKKLKDAITAASDRFEGPLSSPYEPWHYTYNPERPGKK